MFGVVVSTILTLFVIPVLYYYTSKIIPLKTFEEEEE